VIGVVDAAARLGVSPRRVRQLLDTGDLAGERVSGRWVVDEESLRQAASRPGAGRPLSPASAWALLGVLSAADPRSGSRPEQDRAALVAAWRGVPAGNVRHRLRAIVLGRDIDGDLVAALRRRAEGARYWAHPGVVEPLLADAAVSVTGARAAAAHGLDIAPGDEARAYLRERHVAELVERYALEPDLGGNVELLVVPASVPDSLAPHPDRPVGAAVALVDLFADADARSRHLASTQLHDLLTRCRAAALSTSGSKIAC